MFVVFVSSDMVSHLSCVFFDAFQTHCQCGLDHVRNVEHEHPGLEPPGCFCMLRSVPCFAPRIRSCEIEVNPTMHRRFATSYCDSCGWRSPTRITPNRCDCGVCLCATCRGVICHHFAWCRYAWCRSTCTYCHTHHTGLPEKLQTCRNCRSAWYCNKQCQKNDWTMHKIVCFAAQEAESGEG